MAANVPSGPGQQRRRPWRSKPRRWRLPWQGRGERKEKRERKGGGAGRRKRKRIVLMVLGGAVVAFLLYLLLRPKPVEVDAGPAVRGPLQVTVDDEGRTRVRNRYMIAAPVNGMLERLRFEEGDRVRLGEWVAQIDPSPLGPRERENALAQLAGARARLDEALAAVSEARGQAEQAEIEAERAVRLAEAGAMSRQEAEQAVLAAQARADQLEAAKARAEQAGYEIEAARGALAGPGPNSTDPGAVTPVLSPASGAVLRIFQESERAVQAGTEILEVGNPNDLELVVDVLSSDAVEVEPGDPIEVLDWGGERTLPARVTRVDPAAFSDVSALGIEEQRVNILGEFLKPTGPLGDEYRVEARIVIWQAADVLKVPSSALFRLDGGWFVFVIEDGRAKLRGVQTGHRGTEEVEVLGGLRAGELVVLHPDDRIEEDTRVKPGEEEE